MYISVRGLCCVYLWKPRQRAQGRLTVQGSLDGKANVKTYVTNANCPRERLNRFTLVRSQQHAGGRGRQARSGSTVDSYQPIPIQLRAEGSSVTCAKPRERPLVRAVKVLGLTRGWNCDGCYARIYGVVAGVLLALGKQPRLVYIAKDSTSTGSCITTPPSYAYAHLRICVYCWLGISTIILLLYHE